MGLECELLLAVDLLLNVLSLPGVDSAAKLFSAYIGAEVDVGVGPIGIGSCTRL